MVNILYAGNDKMFKALLMSLSSVASHTKEALNVKVATGDFTQIDQKFKALTEEHIQFLDKVLKHYNPDNSIGLFDLTFKSKEIVEGANDQSRFTPYTLLRLYLSDEMYSSFGERFLYLDTDVFALKDIRELYDIDMQGKTIAMAKDNVGVWWLNEHNCNAGVILFDVQKWLNSKEKLTVVRKMIKTKKMVLPDQSAINNVFSYNGDVLFLPSKYNEQKGIREDTVLRHYNSKFRFFPYPYMIHVKPWGDLDKFHKYRKEYAFDSIILKADEWTRQFQRGEEPSF